MCSRHCVLNKSLLEDRVRGPALYDWMKIKGRTWREIRDAGYWDKDFEKNKFYVSNQKTDNLNCLVRSESRTEDFVPGILSGTEAQKG